MTGAIISQFYWKDQYNQYSRYFINGSFFFIEPDLAVTTYSNLADSRSIPGSVYAEDYLYFDSPVKHFQTSLYNSDYIQCIRLEREWLKELPDINITIIKFPFPVSSECFIYLGNTMPENGIVMLEGFEDVDPVSVHEDPESIEFVTLDKLQQKKIKLFRLRTSIESMYEETVYSDLLEIENLEVFNINAVFTGTMVGGPVLNYHGTEILGVLSHEPDDPFADQNFKAVKLPKDIF